MRGSGKTQLAAAIAAILLLSSAPAWAQPASLPAYSASYVGTIGKLPIAVEIDRLGDTLTGTYRYGGNAKQGIALQGRASGGGFELTETAGGKMTGLWHVRLTAGSISGTWSSPDGSRKLPLAATSAPSGKAFPYEIRIVLPTGVDAAAVAAKERAPDACDEDPRDSQVTALDLMDPKTGRLVQRLGQDVADLLSRGTCRVFLPIVEDMNFDGWPDLRIARFLPAAPNVPFAAWLYDPATGKLAFNGELSQIASPRFDAKARRVTSTTRGSCCSYESEVYAWRGKALRLLQRSDLEYATEGAAAEKRCWVEKAYQPRAGKMTLVGTKKGCGEK